VRYTNCSRERLQAVSCLITIRLSSLHSDGNSTHCWLLYTVRHKKLHPSYWYNNFAKLCHTMIIFGIDAHENLITCLFDSLCEIEKWEPAYHICNCLLSSRQQRKMWNSCCNARPQTSSLQTYGLLTVLALILWITGYVEYCSNVFIENLLKTERRWTEVASDWSVVWHPAKCCWSGDWPMASLS